MSDQVITIHPIVSVKKDNTLSSSVSTPNLTEEKKIIVPSGPKFGKDS